jgi:hypothetical protein
MRNKINRQRQLEAAAGGKICLPKPVIFASHPAAD